MSLVLCMAEMWAFCRGKPRDVLGLGSSCWLLARAQADCPADGGEASGRGFAPATLQNAGGMQVVGRGFQFAPPPFPLPSSGEGQGEGVWPRPCRCRRCRGRHPHPALSRGRGFSHLVHGDLSPAHLLFTIRSDHVHSKLFLLDLDTKRGPLAEILQQLTLATLLPEP